MTAASEFPARPDGTTWTVDQWPEMCDEIDRLRRWKSEALIVLDLWDDVHRALGEPAQLGELKPKACITAIDALRAELAAVTAERDLNAGIALRHAATAEHLRAEARRWG